MNYLYLSTVTILVLLCIVSSGDSADPNSYSSSVSDAQSHQPYHQTGGVFYGGRSRVSSTNRRGKNRKASKSKTSKPSRTKTTHRGHGKVLDADKIEPDVIDQSYFQQRYGKDEHGQDLFRWTGKEYTTFPGGARRISKTKTTTKTTKISTSRIGTIGPDGEIIYKYSYPGNTSETIVSNTNTFAELNPDDVRRVHSSTSYSSSGGTSSGSSSSSSSVFNVGSSVNGGGGQIDGDIIYDYEEEPFDPEFAKGVQLSEEDKVHPFVYRGFGYSPGYGQRSSHPCDQSSCYPATGNLLIGRGDRLSATSTCGLYRKEKYCIVSHLKKRKCFTCDSTDKLIGNARYSHRIDNIVHRFDERTRGRSWWQSQNGKQDVSIRLDLEAEFHFTHLIIKFRSFRPAAMLIERSFDFGRTWKIYRYFAHKCESSFPGIPKGPARNIGDVVCEHRYSAVAPSTEGEVIFRVLPPNIRIDNPYSDEVQNLLKITNLRVNFTELHTFGDQLLDTRQEIKEKYYYAIYDMTVRGSCSCYGHASRCLPLEGVVDRSDMVHGKCQCTHNTKGLNCEMCEDFYNDLPWRPAVRKESNACRKCNCHNHATKCHFDEIVYQDSGNITGGVCDDCSHNTQGLNCEECIKDYFQDPSKDMRDVDVCQPCNCDPRGSLDDGTCDSKNDPQNGLLAGRCHCKVNVDGMKCDRCKAGYWNFTNSEEGCQECNCNLLGTVNNAGCNVLTGECTCKRYVVGRLCAQCSPQHYGLSEHPDGCQPCNCDPGGSYNNDCDVHTGQCECRPHVSGRRCETPEEGYFVAALDYLTYEAELAKGSEDHPCQNCQVVQREPPRDGRGHHWTGLGFMRVFDGSFLEFDLENIETSMEYDLVIKYEPQFQGEWDGVQLMIERPGPVNPVGPCSNTRSIDDKMSVRFSENQRQVTLFPAVCLEEGKRYKVRMDFKRQNAHYTAPSASILIDSIVLVPRGEQLPFYSGSLDNANRRQEYTHYRCSEAFYSGHGLDSIPDLCREHHLDSIGLYVYKQAFSCQCDPTGSKKKICNTYGGQCECKTNIVGRTCDRCAPGTYGFGPEGCKACDCSPIGALDNFCDQQSGQCKCHPNTYGRQCNECQPGYWNFPNCQRCDCNGHADTCDSVTGSCHDCRENTTGPNCAICVDGYYGDPRLEVGIKCRLCPCPGTVPSGHSFADRCTLDPVSKDVICECKTGYSGSRCDVCSDNYFGKPEMPGGSCDLCDCSGNIDISRRGNCNPRTGECLACLYNTAGFNCERCKDNYFGDAFRQQCTECVCNILGTNSTSGFCDHETGQCPCYPNVLGMECDQCEVNHWRLASGEGCLHCQCDSVGAFEEQCDNFDGQCRCKPEFGGRQCNQCETNYYGDPRRQCLPCQCERSGSQTLQCDHQTGQCKCREGIGGYKCNECDRGFKGRAPYCQPCGECFDNWDYILDGLKNRTQALIESASKIKQRGATGAYSHDFQSMEDKILDVQNILLSANLTSENLRNLEDLISELQNDLNNHEDKLGNLDAKVDNTTQRISFASTSIADLRAQSSSLQNQAEDLKNKSTKLQEANVEGALNLTRVAGERSYDAQERAKLTVVDVSNSRRYRSRTEALLIKSGDRFNLTKKSNEDRLNEFQEILRDMDDDMPSLNKYVCDSRGEIDEESCDKLCGGAGCRKCGGLSCDDGLINTAERALDFAETAEDTLRKKETNADLLLRGVMAAKRHSDQANDASHMAYEASLLARNKTLMYKADLIELLREIEDFFSTNAAKPSEIKTLAQATIDMNIKLQPEQITELAEKISYTIDSLTNIDAIINATKGNLDIAVKLKARADRAKAQAAQTLSVAQRVVQALNDSEVAQNAAAEAIAQASTDISATKNHLTQITSETSAAQNKANKSLSDVMDLEKRLSAVQSQFLKNDRHMAMTRTAVNQAALKAQKARNEKVDLEDQYRAILDQLEKKSRAAEDASRRAGELKDRATKLAADADSRVKLLQKMEIEYRENENKLDDYEQQIRIMEIRMEEYYKYILKKTTTYATCTSGRR